MMVEVFKTNVTDAIKAEEVKAALLLHFPDTKINFDLDDCDRILRLEGKDFSANDVILLANKKGILCNVLE